MGFRNTGFTEGVDSIAMRISALVFTAVASLVIGIGCQRSDQEAARERAERFQKKAESAAKQLGQDAKQLGAKIDEKAHEVGATRQPGTEATAEEKLKRGAAEVKREGQEAGTKLSRAAQSAKVKYNLSATLGLSAASKIEVDSRGDVVTLRGTVTSPENRAEAQRVASNTAGVGQVVNELTVQP